ncbi:MAG: beta-ketoacyl-[acyl-carrier-protein] synthase family protein [Candidatus Binatia bacterium]
MRRAVITGLGIVGPTGLGIESFWRAVLDGPSAIRPISRFDVTSYSSQIAGEVPSRDYENLLEPRKIRTTTHVTQLALAATELAIQDAKLSVATEDLARVGVCVGTAVGGWRDAESQHGILIERGARRVNPFIVNATPNHSTGAEVAQRLGAQGAHLTISTGCPSSLQALGCGASLIETGELDVCIAGGAESPIIPTILAGMGRTQELCSINDQPPTASRPFDRFHSGLVLSEGSCILVLEAEERAARRAVLPYAEVLGSASSCDANGLFGFDPTGGPGARAIYQLLLRTNLSPTDIDYVCAHANSSPLFDRKESMIIKSVFNHHVRRLPVSSIKGVLGHPFGASGAFQTAAASLAIRHQTVPPTHNLDIPAPDCTLDCLPRHPFHRRVKNALITSYGYGGLNSYLIVKQPQL